MLMSESSKLSHVRKTIIALAAFALASSMAVPLANAADDGVGSGVASLKSQSADVT